MVRWLILLCCAFFGLALLGLGLLVPAHLRAVDEKVLQVAGRSSSSVVQEGLGLVRERKLGPAQMLAQVANDLRLANREELDAAVRELKAAQPQLQSWGAPDMRVDILLWADRRITNAISQPITEVVLRLENRGKIMAYLNASSSFEMRDLLASRGLTNTVLLPPSMSSSGQAFDAAVAVAGLLMDTGNLHPSLRDALSKAAVQAVRTGKSEPLEQALMDFLLLGQKLNYGQLTHFVSRVESLHALRVLAHSAEVADRQLPFVFAGVALSGRPADVGKYLMDFSQTGLGDLSNALQYNAGGVKELLDRNRRVYAPAWRRAAARADAVGPFLTEAAEYALELPWVTLALKWLIYLSGGFVLALGAHYLRRRPVAGLEAPLQVPGFHMAREFLFSLGLLVFLLLVSEPFLSQDGQKSELPFRLRLLPSVSSVAAVAAKTSNSSTLMNQLSLLTLLLFFVLQALIYTACLVKLAEIRRQNVGPRIKLRLLDNEDHLFDAGLYLGFVGTIISLILVSLGVIKPSLMAAYSSTSFGIIFVSIFKIFHLRPTRRRLLLEDEAILAQSYEPEPVNPFSTAT